MSRPRKVPDYVIVGAMKCGTSTLAAQLGAQDGLFMTEPKEPNYFSDDDVFARGPDWYAGLFAGAAPGDLTGEASTHYTKRPEHPLALDRLAAAVPAPRIIYLIRDPVQRAVSHYIHDWTQGRYDVPLDVALDLYPDLEGYGCYGAQIAPWIARFGADAVHVDSLEAIKADPQGVLDRVGAFLGRTGLVWRDDLGRENASDQRLRRGRFDALLVDHPAAAWARRTLVPQAVRDRVKRGRRMETRPVLGDARRARLEDVFLADRAHLRALLPGRDDLDVAYPFAAARRAA